MFGLFWVCERWQQDTPSFLILLDWVQIGSLDLGKTQNILMNPILYPRCWVYCGSLKNGSRMRPLCWSFWIRSNLKVWVKPKISLWTRFSTLDVGSIVGLWKMAAGCALFAGPFVLIFGGELPADSDHFHWHSKGYLDNLIFKHLETFIALLFFKHHNCQATTKMSLKNVSLGKHSSVVDI